MIAFFLFTLGIFDNVTINDDLSLVQAMDWRLFGANAIAQNQ